MAVHLEKNVYKSGEKVDNIERVESFDSYYTEKNYEFR